VSQHGESQGARYECHVYVVLGFAGRGRDEGMASGRRRKREGEEGGMPRHEE